MGHNNTEPRFGSNNETLLRAGLINNNRRHDLDLNHNTQQWNVVDHAIAEDDRLH